MDDARAGTAQTHKTERGKLLFREICVGRLHIEKPSFAQTGKRGGQGLLLQIRVVGRIDEDEVEGLLRAGEKFEGVPPTDAAPRLAASKPNTPLPAKRSSTRHPARSPRRCRTQSKSVPRTRSGVGRSPTASGTASGLCRHIPAEIRTTPVPLEDGRVAKLLLPTSRPDFSDFFLFAIQ